MSRERNALLDEVEAISDAEASLSVPGAEGEAQWSVKEQLGHLAEMETNYRAWVERALEEDGADVSRVRGERPKISLTEATGHTVAELIAQLRGQRVRTIALIESMAPE